MEISMNTQENVQVVKDFLAAIGSGDVCCIAVASLERRTRLQA